MKLVIKTHNRKAILEMTPKEFAIFRFIMLHFKNHAAYETKHYKNEVDFIKKLGF
jgi:hypothetical protein